MHGAPSNGRGESLSKLSLLITVVSVVISAVDLTSAVPYSPTYWRSVVFSHSHISLAQKCTSNRRTPFYRIRYVRISEKIELITKDNARGALKWARGKSL